MDDLASGSPVFFSDYAGKVLRQPWKNTQRHVVVLCFWATWSEPCHQDISGLMELAGRFSDQPVKFFLVSTGERAGTTRETMRSIVEQRGYTLQVLVDATGTVADRYGVQTLPATAVADKHGALRWIRHGPGSSNGDDLAELLNTLVKEPEG
jgi:peroxiredoxin